jgi:hypothetical protein
MYVIGKAPDPHSVRNDRATDAHDSDGIGGHSATVRPWVMLHFGRFLVLRGIVILVWFNLII